MARLAAPVIGLLVVVSAVAAGCGLVPSTMHLVRDRAGVFSEVAVADAEQRLQALSRKHGIWLYVVTDRHGDPPRMLDAPMAEANARRVPAVAMLFDAEGTSPSSGYNEYFHRLIGEAMFDLGPSSLVERHFADGDADAALAAIVDSYRAWIADKYAR